MINYWATPNMGKMHMMQLIEINQKSYTKNKYPYYIYKQWHDPNDYSTRIEKSYVLRQGQSNIETAIKTKTTFGEKVKHNGGELHAYLWEVAKSKTDSVKLHSNTSEEGGDLMERYFGNVRDRKPPDELIKDKDPVEVFFTDKWFTLLQEKFPVSPSTNYLGTFLQPYLKDNTECIIPLVEELCDVDFFFDPYIIMGRQMLGTPTKTLSDLSDQEKYVIDIYRSRKNIIPYKEDLIDCFASKLKRYSNKHAYHKYKTEDASVLYKLDRNLLWIYLDTVVQQVRRIERYFKHNNIEAYYFNMDRDGYKDTFGFEKDELPRTQTHPGNYPQRELYETIAKEYVMMRNMKDMRRRGREYDRL